MNFLILVYLFLPLVTFGIILLRTEKERQIAAITTRATWALAGLLVSLLGLWLLQGMPDHEFIWFTLLKREDYEFPILFFLDTAGAVFLVTILFIFSVITRYCRYYLHREPGYKRFFLTIFAFLFGIDLVVLAGNIDMLFTGWEVVGIASFLLIAFYRDRVLPVRNAFRAFTVYRFCDIGLLLGTLMSHLFFSESQYFSHLHTDAVFNQAMANISFPVVVALSMLVVIAASGKSAQFPFCFWLPRAMEGPTPSSAIFYGALSVHLGVFLLLRTIPLWSYYLFTRGIVLLIGLLTVSIAALSMQVQSNIKAQIAYASITQVGLMFIELALGLESLVLLHFMGNAFLRCYQLLVSPSIVAHLLRVEGAADTQYEIEDRSLLKLPFLKVPDAWRDTLYVLAIQEGNLEHLVKSMLWEPLKRLGYRINHYNRPAIRLAVLAGIIALVVLHAGAHTQIVSWAYVLTAFGMLVASASGFSDKYDVLRAWNTAATSSLLAGLTIWFAREEALFDVLLFLSGVIPAWILGVTSIRALTRTNSGPVSFFEYRGAADKQPFQAMLLFVSFLALSGFPITSAFIGEDLLLHHASQDHIWIAAIITAAFVMNGITLARVFVTLCLGSGIWRPLIEEQN